MWGMDKRECVIDDCHRTDLYGRGLCSKHYQYYRYHGQLDEVAPAVQRECRECGHVIEASLRAWAAEYCSGDCSHRAKYRERREAKGRRAAACEQCGRVLPSDMRTDARFCSAECGTAFHNQRLKSARLERKAGRVCGYCGVPLDPAMHGRARFCSVACRSKGRRHEAYGLTRAELDLLLAQHDVCAICGLDWGKKGPQVDHAHATGLLRGILCNNCNNGIGRFKDDPDRVDAAAAYLRMWLEKHLEG